MRHLIVRCRIVRCLIVRCLIVCYMVSRCRSMPGEFLRPGRCQCAGPSMIRRSELRIT